MSGQHDPEKVLREAQGVAELVAGSKELREVWETPSITPEQKRAVLDAIVAQEGLSKIVRNFVAVLIDHRRIKFLGPIVKQFEIELNQRLGFTET
jgi:F-type H+-transporting ATPase subunit delta